MLILCVTVHNFPCVVHAGCMLLVFIYLFILLAFWLGICVEVDADSYHPPPHVFVPTHNPLFNTSDSYLNRCMPKAGFGAI